MLIILTQCNHKRENKEIEKIYDHFSDHKLLFHNSLILIDKKGDTSALYKKLAINNTKVVSIISAECWKCIDEIQKWEKFCSQYSIDDNIQFYFIFNHVEIEYFKKVQLPELPNKFNFYYILDTKNNFLTLNDIPRNKMFHTFLLDNAGDVEILGSPLYNNQLNKLYIKKLNSNRK